MRVVSRLIAMLTGDPRCSFVLLDRLPARVASMSPPTTGATDRAGFVFAQLRSASLLRARRRPSPVTCI